MERKESRNGLELIKFAAIKLRGNFSAVFMGTLAMVTPLVLVLLVPFIIGIFTELEWIISIGVVLFAILIGPLQMGYIKYFNDVIDGKQPLLRTVYSYLRFSVVTLKSMYIAMILLVLYIIGGILWIVPAGFAVSFFSMTLFFLSRNEDSRLSGVMTECAKYMIGNRLAMFSYKLIFYFVYFCLFVVGALCLSLVILLSMDSMIIGWVIAVCSTIIFVFLYTIVTVYYHSANQIFFEDSIMYHERKRAKKNTIQNIETKSEPTEATKMEEVEEKSNKEVDTQKKESKTKRTIKPDTKNKVSKTKTTKKDNKNGK